MSLFSVNTNLGALAALQSLQANQEALTATQNQVSTGQKVSSAADNPAIYSIAQVIDSNIAGLSSVSDSLNFGAQVIATASSGVQSISTVLTSLQQTVTESGQTGLDLNTLQNSVNADLSSINTYARAATFSGVNLLTTNADSGAAFGKLNVIQGINGSVYSIANQATALNAGAVTLTDALGLTGLSVTGGTTGVQLTLNNNLAISSFATGTPGTDASLQLTAGGKTYAFEFVDDSAAPQPLQTAQGPNTNIVAVHFNSTTQSTNQVVGNLIQSLQNNGFGVVQNTDGTINITGQNVTAAQFGTVSAGTFTAGAGGTPAGITSAALTGTQALISTVQAAVNGANTIAANLGAATQQLAGIQNFTTSLSSALTAGVGALTDADLAAESAKLTSLQTKQQLATQSLSIANKQPQSLLSLFQGL